MKTVTRAAVLSALFAAFSTTAAVAQVGLSANGGAAVRIGGLAGAAGNVPAFPSVPAVPAASNLVPSPVATAPASFPVTWAGANAAASASPELASGRGVHGSAPATFNGAAASQSTHGWVGGDSGVTMAPELEALRSEQRARDLARFKERAAAQLAAYGETRHAGNEASAGHSAAGAVSRELAVSPANGVRQLGRTEARRGVATRRAAGAAGSASDEIRRMANGNDSLR
jgi:hypothetical protein